MFEFIISIDTRQYRFTFYIERRDGYIWKECNDFMEFIKKQSV